MHTRITSVLGCMSANVWVTLTIVGVVRLEHATPISGDGMKWEYVNTWSRL